LAFDVAGFVDAFTEMRAEASGDRLLTKLTTGIAACCARAATGHDAAPPSNLMNSRRLMLSPDDRTRSMKRLSCAAQQNRLANVCWGSMLLKKSQIAGC
jgi:hypothetical protein